MSSRRKSSRARPDSTRLLGLVAALLIGLNLRPAVTTVAATLDEASRALGLSASETTVLATLPVIAFGVSAPLGPWLARRFGVSRVLLCAMWALAAGLVIRVLWPALLLPGTFVAGAAIMAAGTLLPQFLKSVDAPALWVGLSSMSFGVGAALGAALTAPIYAMSGPRLEIAWGVWAVPALLAGIPLMQGMRRLRAAGPTPTPPRAALVFTPRNMRTIAILTLVFGLQALLYFAMTAWMPLLLAERGQDSAQTGWLLAWFSIAGFVPTLVTPILARRRAVLRWVGPGLGVAIAIGMLALYLSSNEQIFWIVGGLGAVQSAAFGLSLSLIITMSTNPATAGVVSAIGQGAGYVIAGAGSLAIGLIQTATNSWLLSFSVMAALGLVLSVVVAAAIRREAIDLVPERIQVATS
ncbi:CP family cyanate transporter-like MFS transporter [Leifsonia psychrotolerans]|uniref:CP family cyanate transporter-like MFS transporter n=1 Tax=Glaciibacter psychrotolerans TaxID=670054 RepID=A0A7Z0EGT8_9MICO|nr:MFS transporter [Leifsonia psychrotolerans]NYJ20639.1 CP family cyanate transporter-like MFS transporter [Leifsonia psychrotolerans]